VPELVALAMPPGPRFVDELRRAWDQGDAVAPLDVRLAGPARRALLEALRPAVVVDEAGERFAQSGSVPTEPGDAAVMASSGTTSIGPVPRPKGVVLTMEAIWASARATSARIGVDPARDRWLCCLPVAHVGGFALIARAILTDTPLALLPRFDAEAVEAEARRGATLVSLVPTTLARIDPAHFRVIVLGGSAPPESLPENVVATYGLTETGSGVVYGGMPLDGVEVDVVPDDRASDGVGRIRLRCPMLARAYRDGSPVAGPDGFFDTGDAGRLDDRRLVVEGRLDELIVTGGEKVWPAAVEAVLAGLDSVAEVAVAGVPDSTWGQRVVAWVVPSDPARPPTLEEAKAVVRAELASFAAPKDVLVVEALPRTSIGKPRRLALAAELGRRSGDDEP